MLWTGLSPDEARKALVSKDKSMRDKTMTLKEAVARFIKDGDNVGVGGFVNIRQPIAITHEMVRHGFKNLTLSFQSAGLAADYLAGAMMLDESRFSIKRIELAYWAHESFGLSPMFRYLAEHGKIEIEDWSNYNMSARFKAGAMGLPFLPTRSPLAGDVPSSNRTKIIDCPFTGRKIALVPASNPNVAIIHVNAADKYGNCIIRGTAATCPEISMAAAHTIVTCEQLVDHEVIANHPKDVGIPFPAVDAVIHVPFGAYPGACRGHYYFNGDHIRRFHESAAPMHRSGDSNALRTYYEKYIYGVETFGDFIKKFPADKLMADQAAEAKNCQGPA
jgi:glutaconate CoA-transferase subunit A